jgi:O-antigen/teichoic acid export membrane protein
VAKLAPAEAAQRVPGLLLTLWRTRLYTSAFYLWADSAVISGFGFVFWIVVARLHHAEDVGLAAAAVAALMLLREVCSLGLGFGLIRFLPDARRKSVSLLNGTFTLAALAAVAVTVIFLVGIPLWAPSLGFLRDQPLHSLLYLLFAIGVTVWFVQAYAFVAVRRAEFMLLADTGASVLKLILAVALALFLAPFSIVAAWGSAAVASLAASSFWLLRRAQPSYRPAVELRNWPNFDMLSYSGGNYISELLLIAPGLLLPIIVVNALGGETAAYFYMAWTMSILVVHVSVSLSLSLFSEGSHDREQLRQGFWHSLATAVTVSALAVIVLLVAADKLLLAFGSDYANEGAAALRILALAALPACVTNMYMGVERVRKGIGKLILISLVVAGVTLGSACLLVEPMGMEGVALAWLAGQCIGAAIAMGQYFLESRRSATGAVND